MKSNDIKFVKEGGQGGKGDPPKDETREAPEDESDEEPDEDAWQLTGRRDDF
jgi:hypothetical protein